MFIPKSPRPPGFMAKFWLLAVVIALIPVPVKLKSAPFPESVIPVVPG